MVSLVFLSYFFVSGCTASNIVFLKCNERFAPLRWRLVVEWFISAVITASSMRDSACPAQHLHFWQFTWVSPAGVFTCRAMFWLNLTWTVRSSIPLAIFRGYNLDFMFSQVHEIYLRGSTLFQKRAWVWKKVWNIHQITLTVPFKIGTSIKSVSKLHSR